MEPSPSSLPMHMTIGKLYDNVEVRTETSGAKVQYASARKS